MMNTHNHYTRFFTLFFFLLSTVVLLSAQQIATPNAFCGQKKLHDARIATDEEYAKRQAQLSKWIYQNSLQNNAEKTNEVFQIPIVVHILHLSSDANPADGTSNPTDAQINTAVQHLNEAFRNIGSYADHGRAANDPNNPDADLLQSVDVGIEFCLAQRDINDEPTNGILRYENDEFSELDQSEDDAMKQWVARRNVNRYPTTDYANIYLVNRICDEGDCGTAGYAYLAGAHGLFYDGIVCESFWFGTQPTFSTVHIHEFGHYFDLYHTFEENCNNEDCLLNGDLVCDTPPDISQTAVTCGESENSCNTDLQSGPFSIDQEDLYENYMDYSNDNCNNTFTQGQKDRMRMALQGIRASLLTSQGCIPLSEREVALKQIRVPNTVICGDDFQPMIEVENLGTATVTSLTISGIVDGGNAVATNWTGTLEPSAIVLVPLELNSVVGFGAYEFCANITAVNGISGDAFSNNNEACTNFAYQNPLSELEYCESFEINNSSLIQLESPAGTQDVLLITELNTCENNDESVLMLDTWFQNIPKDGVARVRLPVLNLSQYDSPSLHFNRAYTRTFSNTNTVLKVLASTDCGATFDTLYSKTDVELATRLNPEVGEVWQPRNCNDWALDSVVLDQYAGLSSLQLFFEMAIAPTESSFFNWGNNLYLDNICVRGETCAPLIVNNLAEDLCGDLSLTVENSIEEEEQIGWLISRDSLSNFEDKDAFVQFLDGANLDGNFLANEVVVLPSNEDEKNLNLPSLCEQLPPDQKLYLTPFVAQNLAAIEDVTIKYEDGRYLEGRFRQLEARLYQTDILLPGTPSVIVNDPVFSITIEVTDYESDSTDIQFFFQQDNIDLALTLQKVIPQEGNIGNYIFEQAELVDFDPQFGFRIWAFSEADIELLEWEVTIDVFYEGRPASPFPSIGIFNNCTLGESIEIDCECTDNCALEIIEVLREEVSGCEQMDGHIEIIVSTETNLEYSLDGENWQNESVFNNLSSGTYLPQVRDANSTDCSAQAVEITLSEPNVPTILEVLENHVSDCGLSDGVITIQAEEGENLEYSIDSITWQSSNRFEGLVIGSYFAYVRKMDSPTCLTSSSAVVITSPQMPSIMSFEASDISDCGAMDGQIEVNVLEEFEGLEYSLDGENWQNEAIFEDLLAGNYEVFIRNGNAVNCQDTLSEIEIKMPDTPSILTTEITAVSDCGAEDAIISITTDLESTEYSLDGESWQLESNFSNLPPSNYFVYIRNANAPACRTISDALSIVPPNLPDIEDIENIPPSQCGMADGRITIFTDVINNYEYSIDSGATWQTSNEFQTLLAGNYALQIRVTNSPSCLSEIQNIALSPANPTNFAVSLSADRTTFCKGEMLTFSIQISNGVAPYTVTYTDGNEVFILENYQSGDVIEATFEDATTYEVLSITDANSCSGDVIESMDFRLGGDECRFATFKGTLATEDGRVLSGARMELTGDRNEIIIIDEQGNYTLENLDIEGKYQLIISYETHILNGLSTFDLQLISKHILDRVPLESPYKLVAADINNSGTITSMDMLALRKVLLEFDDTFPDNTVWRFVPADDEFIEQGDTAPPFSLQFKNLKAGAQQLNIVAVKIGDINLTSKLP